MEDRTTQDPTIGRIVHYKLSTGDVEQIVLRRARTGETAFNPIADGDIFPAPVVRAWGSDCVNLQVALDGIDSHWVTSVSHGAAARQWLWPGEREDIEGALAERAAVARARAAEIRDVLRSVLAAHVAGLDV